MPDILRCSRRNIQCCRLHDWELPLSLRCTLNWMENTHLGLSGEHTLGCLYFKEKALNRIRWPQGLIYDSSFLWFCLTWSSVLPVMQPWERQEHQTFIKNNSLFYEPLGGDYQYIVSMKFQDIWQEAVVKEYLSLAVFTDSLECMCWGQEEWGKAERKGQGFRHFLK